MIPRYSRPEAAAIWTPQARFKIMFEVEAYAADAMAEIGVIPKLAAETIWEKGKDAIWDADRIDEIEREVKHDVVAFLTHLAEIVGPIDSETLGAKADGQFFEIGRCDFRVFRRQALVDEVVPLLPNGVVVEHEHGERQIVTDRGVEI